jgi:glycerophosphoryl diester phosphodiesterase
MSESRHLWAWASVRVAEVEPSHATPLVVGHRGEPVTHVENTLPAVLAGFALGADMVEIDLKLTADDEVVAVHDDRLHRVWRTEGTVQGSTWSELQRLRRDGSRIPVLSEVLSATSGSLMLDLGGSQVATAALEVVRRLGALARCLFVSGDAATLSRLRALDPGARLGLTWRRPRLPDPGLLRELSPEYWNPAYGVASRRRVEALHDLGYQVSVWTVDHRYRMSRALSLGVDAVVTNRIARLVALRAAR